MINKNRLFYVLGLLLIFWACNSTKKINNSDSHMLLGTYSSAPRMENSRVDVDKLISQLEDLHANTYNFLIWTNENDWDDLKLFLPKANKKGIKVWVSLVPPSESKPKARWNSEPFGMDYITWAKEIAKLSNQYTNLVAWSIDDFAHNLSLYTPEYVENMLNAARSVNKKLLFVPCLYYRQITAPFAEKYGNLIDGVLFPYRAESSKKFNLQDATLVKTEIENVRKLFSKSIPVLLDVYSTAHSRLGSSTPQYVHDVIAEGLKYADGVFIYTHPINQVDINKYDVVKELFKKESSK
ncbi:MAG: hypothetical protein ACK5NK_13135 [Niabella sp.]